MKFSHLLSGLALLAQWICEASGVRFGTLSFNTFSEVIFQFRITPLLVASPPSEEAGRSTCSSSARNTRIAAE